jgi:Peptidase S24-like.
MNATGNTFEQQDKIVPNDLFFDRVESLIAEGKSVSIKVLGNSMRPTIRNGVDMVQLYPTVPGDLKRGDIVLFRYKGAHCLHRIVACQADGYVLEGDGNYKSREYALPEDIVAVVRYILRPGAGRSSRKVRKIDVHTFFFRFYSFIWLFLRPLRRSLLAAGRRLGWF